MSADILIVDDEDDIRELVSGILQDEGYPTRTAPNSHEAQGSVVARRPNLIFLYIWPQNSRLDGLQLLNSLRLEHPIVVMSGHSNTETAVSAIKRVPTSSLKSRSSPTASCSWQNLPWKIPASGGAHPGRLIRQTIDNHELVPIFMKSKSKGPRYTNLCACISEEEDSYTVQVRIYDQSTPQSTAWGEEVANCLEIASRMVSALAAKFSIGQSRNKIEVRMRDPKGGTRH